MELNDFFFIMLVSACLISRTQLAASQERVYHQHNHQSTKKDLCFMVYYFRVPATTATLGIFLNTITKGDIKNILHQYNSTSLV